MFFCPTFFTTQANVVVDGLFIFLWIILDFDCFYFSTWIIHYSFDFFSSFFYCFLALSCGSVDLKISCCVVSFFIKKKIQRSIQSNQPSKPLELSFGIAFLWNLDVWTNWWISSRVIIIRVKSSEQTLNSKKVISPHFLNSTE